jgi:hypothetical protein
MSMTLAMALLLMTKASTMNDILEAVIADQKRVGEVIQPPTKADALQRLQQAVQTSYNASVPADVLSLLRKAGGIDYNGVVIYGADQSPEKPGPGGFWQGLLVANQLWREGSSPDFLIVGETDMDLLTVDLSGAKAATRDKVSHDVNETFDNAGEMIAEVLKRRL